MNRTTKTGGGLAVGGGLGAVLAWVWGLVMPEAPMPPEVAAALAGVLGAAIGLMLRYLPDPPDAPGRGPTRFSAVWPLLVALPLLGGGLGGCAGLAAQTEDYLGQGGDALLNASRVAHGAALRYECDLVRIGVLREALQTDEQREAHRVMCGTLNSPLAAPPPRP